MIVLLYCPNAKGICEHGREKDRCKDCPNATGRCEHGRVKDKCIDCPGASKYCEHKKNKALCKQCPNPSQICQHNKNKRKCKDCNPESYLTEIVGHRVREALKANKVKRSYEYLGCTIEEFKNHIEKQFKDGMTWDNYGEWEIDHKIPLMYSVSQRPTIEQVSERLHYTNTQPLWKDENLSKGNRFISE